MRSFTLAIVVGLFMALAGGAQAAPSVTGIFDLPEDANRIALGPDGNLWVTLNAASPNVARVSPDGTVTPMTATDLPFPIGISAAPDGKLWVTGAGYVGQFSPANPLDATKTLEAGIAEPQDVTVGPDGNLWTASGANVFRITPTPVPTISPFASNVAGFSARGITSSTEGLIWVANGGTTPGILPMSTAGVAGAIQAVPDPDAKIMDVAGGPGGQVAFTQPVVVTDEQRIGQINGGAITTSVATPGKDATGITFGQDGAYWAAQFTSASVGRYTTDGQYSELGGLPAGGRRIAKGPGNTLWVMYDQAGRKVARISGVEVPDTAVPTITNLKLTNTKFKVGKKKTALVAKSKKKKTPTGTTLSYTLSEIATASIAVQKATAGRRSGTACVKPTSKLKKAKAKKCTRYVVIKTLTRLQLAGANKVSFSGRIDKTKLKVGKYRFLITAQDAKGNISAPTKKSFTIVK